MGRRNARRLGKRLEMRWLSIIETTAVMAAAAMAPVSHVTDSVLSFLGCLALLYLTLMFSCYLKEDLIKVASRLAHKEASTTCLSSSVSPYSS